ncbi:sodium:solute symporter [Algivirga pacifica]|uniref:Sodium:solute symporter n=1 Tax=Algivirga pacifica TaxID=1162670 RepID=A0ABP9D4X0_9BACT
MKPTYVLAILVAYFLVLMLISYLTSRGADKDTFFTGNRKSPWYLVAFGMVGASLSGVTFISVPGAVGGSGWSYLQFVLGNFVGYWVIAFVLIPLYYRMKLTSIYEYLRDRYGNASYKTGALFFMLSQTIGASFRLFLVALVLQLFFFDAYNIPFGVTVFITILLIWLYTFKAGIKTIVWTDTLQTLFMLSSVGISIWLIATELDLSLGGVVTEVKSHPYADIFVWDGKAGNNFFKQFIAGIFIAIVMNGLDQNMMQKNLTCKSRWDAQKNLLSFSITFVISTVLFLVLGVMLYMFAEAKGVEIPGRTDALYATLALEHFGTLAGTVFLLGITAAAYSSADSALTALTTSFCVDMMDISHQPEEKQKKIRRVVHIGFSTLMVMVIILFKMFNDETVVTSVFKAAGYTYGPLLGLFAFGMLTKRKPADRLVPLVCILSPVFSYILNANSEELLWGYKFGFEILIVNGLFTFIGLWTISGRRFIPMQEPLLSDSSGDLLA